MYSDLLKLFQDNDFRDEVMAINTKELTKKKLILEQRKQKLEGEISELKISKANNQIRLNTVNSTSNSKNNSKKGLQTTIKKITDTLKRVYRMIESKKQRIKKWEETKKTTQKQQKSSKEKNKS